MKTTKDIRKTLQGHLIMKLLTDETASLAEAHALLAKDLDERANTPLKMIPVREHWHFGPK